MAERDGPGQSEKELNWPAVESLWPGLREPELGCFHEPPGLWDAHEYLSNGACT